MKDDGDVNVKVCVLNPTERNVHHPTNVDWTKLDLSVKINCPNDDGEPELVVGCRWNGEWLPLKFFDRKERNWWDRLSYVPPRWLPPVEAPKTVHKSVVAADAMDDYDKRLSAVPLRKQRHPEYVSVVQSGSLMSKKQCSESGDRLNKLPARKTSHKKQILKEYVEIYNRLEGAKEKRRQDALKKELKQLDKEAEELQKKEQISTGYDKERMASLLNCLLDLDADEFVYNIFTDREDVLDAVQKEVPNDLDLSNDGTLTNGLGDREEDSNTDEILKENIDEIVQEPESDQEKIADVTVSDELVEEEQPGKSDDETQLEQLESFSIDPPPSEFTLDSTEIVDFMSESSPEAMFVPSSNTSEIDADTQELPISDESFIVTEKTPDKEITEEQFSEMQSNNEQILESLSEELSPNEPASEKLTPEKSVSEEQAAEEKSPQEIVQDDLSPQETVSEPEEAHEEHFSEDEATEQQILVEPIADVPTPEKQQEESLPSSAEKVRSASQSISPTLDSPVEQEKEEEGFSSVAETIEPTEEQTVDESEPISELTEATTSELSETPEISIDISHLIENESAPSEAEFEKPKSVASEGKVSTKSKARKTIPSHPMRKNVPTVSDPNSWWDRLSKPRPLLAPTAAQTYKPFKATPYKSAIQRPKRPSQELPWFDRLSRPRAKTVKSESFSKPPPFKMLMHSKAIMQDRKYSKDWWDRLAVPRAMTQPRSVHKKPASSKSIASTAPEAAKEEEKEPQSQEETRSEVEQTIRSSDDEIISQ